MGLYDQSIEDKSDYPDKTLSIGIYPKRVGTIDRHDVPTPEEVKEYQERKRMN